ncbi:MAG: hypothetical protein ACOC3X_01005 [Nanoarchaeota archaeon]
MENELKLIELRERHSMSGQGIIGTIITIFILSIYFIICYYIIMKFKEFFA